VIENCNSLDQPYLQQKRHKVVMEEGVSTQDSVRKEKESFSHLLKLGVVETQAAGKVISLETNEEIARLVPVLCHYFSSEELVELVGERMATKFLELYRVEMLQNLFLEQELQRLLHAFNQAQIPLILFKGPVLAHTVYPEVSLRTYHDLDLLVRPPDLARAHALLVAMEYAYYEEFRANTIDSKRVGYNYTVKSPYSLLEVLIELHTAPHPGQGGIFFDPDIIWARAQQITILGEPTLTMSLVDHLLYLCWHYRFHGFTRLIWLYDIVAILRSAGAKIDWEVLVDTARNLHLATNLYYCLTWCRDLFGVAIPEYVLKQLYPPLICRVLIERVAMPNAARALSSSSWRQRRMLARRAMVDKPFELIASAIQMLFPRPAIMGRRYLNDSRLPMSFVFLLYIIHPLILLLKGCRKLMKKKR